MFLLLVIAGLIRDRHDKSVVARSQFLDLHLPPAPPHTHTHYPTPSTHHLRSHTRQVRLVAPTLAAPFFCMCVGPLLAGGDVKGSAKVEPYAYWPLDRRLMNRRQQKSKGAKKGLDKIVAAAKEGAAKGQKAKRQRQK